MIRLNLLGRVRWCLVLPLVVSAITAGLIIVAQRDNAAFLAAHPGISASEFQSPAALLAQALNGPVFFYPHSLGLLDAGWIRLPGVVLFWAWLGSDAE